MNVQFCRLDILIENRPLYDAAGRMVTDRLPLQVGGHLLHWAAPGPAWVWFKEAKRLLEDREAIARLDAPVNTQDARANASQALAQFNYVLQIVSAISRGYNLLNIVAWNDPIARQLYRYWIAGPPEMFGQNSSEAVFDQASDYNPNWYTGTQHLPMASMSGGKLQQTALRQTSTQPGGFFFPSALVVMTSVQPVGNGLTVENSAAVRNSPFVQNEYSTYCQGQVDFPISYACGMQGARVVFGGPASVDPAWAFRAVMPDGSVLPYMLDDWRAAYAGSFYGGREGGVAAPLRSYLQYFSTWVNGILSRTPYQVIQDSRAFVVYQNSRTITLNGGTDVAIGQILRTDQDVYAQMHTPNSSLDAAAAAAPLLGTAIGAAAGGIGAPLGAVIGGAVGAVIKIVNLSIPGDVRGHGRDDLGRYKLRFERGWLSGNPAAASPDEGAPALPADDLNFSPTFAASVISAVSGSPETANACPTAAMPASTPAPGEAPPAATGIQGSTQGGIASSGHGPSGAAVVIGLLAVGGIGYAGWRAGWFKRWLGRS